MPAPQRRLHQSPPGAMPSPWRPSAVGQHVQAALVGNRARRAERRRVFLSSAAAAAAQVQGGVPRAGRDAGVACGQRMWDGLRRRQFERLPFLASPAAAQAPPCPGSLSSPSVFACLSIQPTLQCTANLAEVGGTIPVHGGLPRPQNSPLQAGTGKESGAHALLRSTCAAASRAAWHRPQLRAAARCRQRVVTTYPRRGAADSLPCHQQNPHPASHEIPSPQVVPWDAWRARLLRT